MMRNPVGYIPQNNAGSSAPAHGMYFSSFQGIFTMAKVTKLHPGKDDGNDDGENGGDNKTIKAISAKDQKALIKQIRTAESELGSARGTIGQLVSDACERKHGHKGAIGIFRRFDKMDPYKRAEMRFHLDTMIKQSDWEDPKDLFRDNPTIAAE